MFYSTFVKAKYIGNSKNINFNEYYKLSIIEDKNTIKVYLYNNNKDSIVYKNFIELLSDWSDICAISFSSVKRKHVTFMNYIEYA